MAAPFRKCDHCARPATVHQVVIVNGKPSEMHLCEEHAAAVGLKPAENVPIHQLLGALAQAGTPRARGPACPGCGHTFHDFKSTALLGCAACYDTFSSTLEVSIERAQGGGTHHVGRTPPTLDGMRDRTIRLQQLARELEQAVAAEQYERAAQVRDLMKGLRAGPVGDPAHPGGDR